MDLLANSELDRPASRGPVGRVRGAGVRAGVPGGQRVRAGAGGIVEGAGAGGECGVCAAAGTFCLCQPKSLVSYLSLPVTTPVILPEVPIEMPPIAVVHKHMSTCNSSSSIRPSSTRYIIKPSIKSNQINYQ